MNLRRFVRSVSLGALAMVMALVIVGPVASAQPARDIVDTAVAAGQFSTLARALTAANLVDTLKGAGPFTVFAPTDAAFAKVPPATLNALLANQAQLRAVLTYHVVPGRVTAAEVTRLTSAKTVQGGDLRLALQGSSVRINDATVTQADVMASNGVIHVIDTVLMPPASASAPGNLPRAGEAGAEMAALIVVAGLGIVGLGFGLRRRWRQ